MEQRALADKLMDLSKNHSKEIIQQWYRALITNPRTLSFRKIPKETLLSKAESFLASLKQMYFSENPHEEVQRFWERSGYMEYTRSLHIPLHENVYSMIMMRRQIWLYANNQAMFNTSLDMWQALDSINRTILLFDYSVVILAKFYADQEAGTPIPPG